MSDETTLQTIREQLRDIGGVKLDGPNGKAVYLVLNRNLGIEKNGILISYEGGGAYFFDLDRPLNQFRLVTNGFSLAVAPALAKMVNDILSSEASNEEPVNTQLLTSKEN